VDRAFD
jgi:hypothetical protein